MKITQKTVLVETQGVRIVRMSIVAPDIARKARAGQFVVLMVREEGERFPLTVASTDLQAGTLDVIAQEAGTSTRLLGAMEPGQSLYSIVGPLGHATEIRNYGKVVLVGGGVGIAEIYPVARAMKEAGNHVTTIIGARNKDLLILAKELGAASHELVVMSDDGSCGRQGFVTEALKELLVKTPPDLVYAVGPVPMMRAVAGVTGPFGVKTLLSLNPIMVDGTGMCGGCRVTVGGEVKFSCVDGPEFEASQVDWNELMMRNRTYVEQEQHMCRLHSMGSR
ncbi:MAG: sulfide/dihydroorotate dehydrogenase-like FAD/NAD-binding protein [Elusimicrobia bacterium]|nr:sulfide/dihydroorotate dehydrogenase-like FAD/NAD-binding protein [Elusimicrobiota bacterium]